MAACWLLYSGQLTKVLGTVLMTALRKQIPENTISAHFAPETRFLVFGSCSEMRVQYYQGTAAQLKMRWSCLRAGEAARRARMGGKVRRCEIKRTGISCVCSLYQVFGFWALIPQPACASTRDTKPASLDPAIIVAS